MIKVSIYKLTRLETAIILINKSVLNLNLRYFKVKEKINARRQDKKEKSKHFKLIKEKEKEEVERLKLFN
jgi:hypothetical protein